ncbi:MAG: nucleoside-diphosphate kinase [Candidatus Woesearchaeota archaeon]
MIERTLVLLKPDAVQRCLMGEIISRFERAGLKIVGMKMIWANAEHTKKHYTEDISKRRGEHVREKLIKFLQEGPVVAICLEGSSAIEVTRKMVGDTEPKKALPGTIRGDFAHHSYHCADVRNVAVRNIIHASSDKNEAEREIQLWFKPEELHSYKTVHDIFTQCDAKW